MTSTTRDPLPSSGEGGSRSEPGEGQSFPREARLLKPYEFALVQERGRTADLGPLVFRWIDRANLPPKARPPNAAPDAMGRLGLAVSKRVGNAVQRNHVKRRVRECFRRRKWTLQGLDLVVSGRPAAAPLDVRDIGAIFDQFADRLGRTRHPDEPAFEPPLPRRPVPPIRPPSARP